MTDHKPPRLAGDERDVLLAETARHPGHADILRELADGTNGR